MNRYKDFILGALILFLFFLQLLIWLKVDNAPVAWDPANHLTDNLHYFYLLSHPSIDAFKKIIHTSIYPPFVALSVLPFYFFFGVGDDRAILYQNLIYIPLLVITTCMIVKRMGSQKMGVFPLLLLLTYPQIYEASSKFFLDIPLAALVSLSVYGIMCTENFTKQKNCILLGAMLGIGMLIKWSFCIFLAGPIIIAIAFSLKDGFKYGNLKKRVINIITSLLIGVLTASFWYLPNFKRLVSHSVYSAIEEGAFRGQPLPLSLQSMLFYIITLVNEQITFIYIVLFLMGLGFFFKKVSIDKLIIISWIIVPYIILTFLISLKQSRYMLPTLPAFAIITTIGLSGLTRNYFKLLVTFATGVAILQLLAINFGVQFFSSDFRIPLFENQRLILFRSSSTYNIPKGENWRVEEVLSAIHQYIQKDGGSKPRTIVFANHHIYNCVTLDYYSRLKKYNLVIKRSMWLDKSYLHDLLDDSNYRYFIFKTWPNISHVTEKKIFMQAIASVYAHSESFSRIFTQKNPDNSFTFIYKKVLPLQVTQNRNEILKALRSPVKIKSLSLDKTTVNIKFEGGVPPYALELYVLRNPDDLFFLGIGHERAFIWKMTEAIRDTIIGQGGSIGVKVVDVLGNESKGQILTMK